MSSEHRMYDTRPLFTHRKHPHTPKNVNEAHRRERGSLNDRIAVLLTRTIGSMQTAYLFIGIALVGLLAILGIFRPLVALLVAWASQTLIQLVLLPVIMVGQNVLNRHAELQADETYQTSQHSFHDIEQVMAHLSTQDDELLKQMDELLKQTPMLDTALAQLNTQAAMLADITATMADIRARLPAKRTPGNGKPPPPQQQQGGSAA